MKESTETTKTVSTPYQKALDFLKAETTDFAVEMGETHNKVSISLKDNADGEFEMGFINPFISAGCVFTRISKRTRKLSAHAIFSCRK